MALKRIKLKVHKVLFVKTEDADGKKKKKQRKVIYQKDYMNEALINK